jgi:acyl-coenzyme A synthetase/AMP-(fatty) acid ligase
MSLPRAALPREVIAVEELPKLASGKLDRLEVRRIAG